MPDDAESERAGQREAAEDTEHQAEVDRASERLQRIHGHHDAERRVQEVRDEDSQDDCSHQPVVPHEAEAVRQLAEISLWCLGL